MGRSSKRDRLSPQKKPFSSDKMQLPQYEVSIRGQDFKISKRLDAAIDKFYRGFCSLKEACEEVYNICKEEGIQEALIGDIIRAALKKKGLSNRSVLRYLPDELKDRSKVRSPSSQPRTKLSANEDKKNEEQSSGVYYYKSSNEAEKQKREDLETQFIEASFKPAAEILGDPAEEKLRQIQERRDVNRISSVLEFSPGILDCLELILKNQNDMLYLQHDGHKVIKVTDTKPIEQGGDTVS